MSDSVRFVIIFVSVVIFFLFSSAIFLIAMETCVLRRYYRYRQEQGDADIPERFQIDEFREHETTGQNSLLQHDHHHHIYLGDDDSESNSDVVTDIECDVSSGDEEEIGNSYILVVANTEG